MAFALIFFFATTLLLFGFLGWKLFLLRKGHIGIVPHTIEKGFREDVQLIRRKVVHHAHRSFRVTIFTLGKTWVVVSYLAEKRLRKHFPKLFRQKPKSDTQEPSLFLKTISEYKSKMRRFKKRIREADEEKGESSAAE